jgi:hypothetical protein
MNLLFLYQFKEEYNFDHWLHMSWLEYISKLNYCGIAAYGPGIHNAYPKVSVCPYNAVLTLYDLRNYFNFDVVICMTKSRMFFNYNPKRDIADGCWLPSDFASWNKTPKVSLEEDAHYEKDGKWEQSMKFDLILQRHYSQAHRDGDGSKFWGVPTKWHPFSVDMTIFNQDRMTIKYGGEFVYMTPGARQKKIAFVGNYADEAYKYRKEATRMLLANNICADYNGARKIDMEYVKVLRKYLAYVSCGSIYEITAAKNLEIMASGGILFTNKFMGIDEFLPPNTYCAYKNDCSDVAAQGSKLIYDIPYGNEILKNAWNCIRQRHTHEQRLREMIDIFRGIGVRG